MQASRRVPAAGGFRYVDAMAPFPILFLLFLLVPLVEIWFLIVVGGVIGALPTVGLVVLTALVGAALARIQGLAIIGRLQATLARGEVPAFELLEGVLTLVGALLLLTPGFFTDAAGFICLFPVTRRALAWRGVKHFATVAHDGQGGPASGAGSRHHEARIIEGEFRREDDISSSDKTNPRH